MSVCYSTLCILPFLTPAQFSFHCEIIKSQLQAHLDTSLELTMETASIHWWSNIFVVISVIISLQGALSTAQDLPINVDAIKITPSPNQQGSCPSGSQLEATRSMLFRNVTAIIEANIDLINPPPIPPRPCGCGGPGWTRIAYLNMSEATQTCPTAWRLRSSPIRTCGRSVDSGCSSASYDSGGLTYNEVCGRLIGYQFGSTEAFWYYNNRGSVTIDSPYVDGGVSITHGSPRQHIWTLASGHSQTATTTHDCRCNTGNEGVGVPPWVGDDYFCDSATTVPSGSPPSNFYTEDPLWDGVGCGSTTTCCEFNNPPWFCKQLPQATSDSIEIRLCGDEHLGNEDTPIEVVEIYVR